MRVNNINVNNFSFISITNCEIDMNINKHSKAIISGIIDANNEDLYLSKITSNSWATINGIDEYGNKEPLFSGIIYDATFDNDNDMITMTLELRSGTILMDKEKKIRSFQNKGITYNSIFNEINGSYGASHILSKSDSATGEYIVQYEETDWSFIKRMASNLNTCIIPSVQQERVLYFVGCNEGSATESIVNISDYKTKKEIRDKSFISYSFESREYIPLGNKVELKNNKAYIYSLQSRWIGGELVNFYNARPMNGFYKKKYYNPKLIGASLKGTVASVSKGKIKANIPEDVTGASIMFNYATPYSSTDGAGWYCMPEVGDNVRICFPSEEGNEAYAISSIHIGESGFRQDPDKKSIMNCAQKQIEITPSSIKLTNNSGMTILIDDNKGIDIECNKQITIDANEGINLNSLTDSVIIEAPKMVKLKQGNSELTLKDKVTVKGSEVKLQ